VIIDTFRDKYLFLSNSSQARVRYNGLEFKNSEAAFQAQKVLDVEGQVPFTQMPPKEARRRGRQVKLRPDWEEEKRLKMYEDVFAGKEIICPVCGKGTLYKHGPYIRCTADCCRYLVHFYYAHEHE